MTAFPRVEPPEELRTCDGWHWLHRTRWHDELLPIRWSEDTGSWRWLDDFVRPAEMAHFGWRYVAPCLTPAEAAALRAERDAARKENDSLRGLLAKSDMPCPYCQLPAAEIGRCERGFPGCGRADDMMAVPGCALENERDAAVKRAEALADKLQPFADAYAANKFSSCMADMMMSVAPQHWSDAAAARAAYRAASPETKP